MDWGLSVVQRVLNVSLSITLTQLPVCSIYTTHTSHHSHTHSLTHSHLLTILCDRLHTLPLSLFPSLPLSLPPSFPPSLSPSLPPFLPPSSSILPLCMYCVYFGCQKCVFLVRLSVYCTRMYRVRGTQPVHPRMSLIQPILVEFMSHVCAWLCVPIQSLVVLHVQTVCNGQYEHVLHKYVT